MGVVTQDNPNTQEADVGIWEVNACLGCIMRPYLKQTHQQNPTKQSWFMPEACQSVLNIETDT